MKVLRSCLCWRDIRSACIACTTFIMTTSFVQLMLQLALWLGFGMMMRDTLAGNWLNDYPYFAMYIGLAGMDFFVIMFSIMVLWGESKLSYRSNCFIPLLIVLPLYILYEASINVYYLVVMFQAYDSATGVAVIKGGLTFPIESVGVIIAYWALKLLLTIPCYLTILSTFHEGRSSDHGDFPSNHSASTRGYILKTNPYDSYGKRNYGDMYGGRRNYGYRQDLREYRDRDLYERDRYRGNEYKRY